MGDGRICLKTGRDASLIKIYRMSLISAGSISLDSTFNRPVTHWSAVLILHPLSLFQKIWKKRPYTLQYRDNKIM